MSFLSNSLSLSLRLVLIMTWCCYCDRNGIRVLEGYRDRNGIRVLKDIEINKLQDHS